jgi:hypothetical protein
MGYRPILFLTVRLWTSSFPNYAYINGRLRLPSSWSVGKSSSILSVSADYSATVEKAMFYDRHHCLEPYVAIILPHRPRSTIRLVADAVHEFVRTAAVKLKITRQHFSQGKNQYLFLHLFTPMSCYMSTSAQQAVTVTQEHN